MGQSEVAGLVVLPVESRDTRLELNPAHEGPVPHCSVAGKGGRVGAVDGLQGAAAWETGSETGEEALGRDLGDGTQGVLQAQARALPQALGEAAGCRAGNPEEELDGGSFHPDGLVMGHCGSAGGGGGDDGHWGDGGGGDCCCCCSGDGCCCVHGDGGGGSDGLSGHAGVSLEGCDGFEGVCGISLACSGGVVCD